MSKQNDFLLDIDNFRMARPIEINPLKHLSNYYRNQANSPTDSSLSSPSDSSLSPTSSLASKSETKITNANSKSNTAANSSSSLANRKLTVLRRINFFDEKNRPLFLIARIIFKIGSGLLIKSSELNDRDITSFNPCPILIQISAIYCFFNMTGLPLIFRQYNCDESAGQLDEHEMACNSQPLLFSFNEIDSPYACSMRIGKHFKDFHQHNYYRSRSSSSNISDEENSVTPKWCKPFGLDSGSSFRGLKVTNNFLASSNLSESNNQAWVIIFFKDKTYN